jgi:oligogalacturonide transport system permease protein
MKKKIVKWIKTLLKYIGLIALGLVFLFPIIWMVMGTFKDNIELFSSLKLWPNSFNLDGFINGWKGSGQITYSTFFLNSVLMVLPTTVFTVLSSILIGYGFARFNFRFKKPLFAIMIATMMLPNAVLIIPRYLIFNALDWLNSYKVFYIPALFGCYPFFIYMFVQFFRGIPRELDEAAKIDGCNSFRILRSVLLPLLKPVILSGIVFQAAWTWEDFFNPLIYISSTEKFPVSLALRMSLDAAAKVDYNAILAMATLSLLPIAILFFLAQKSFVEGVTTTGLKG